MYIDMLTHSEQYKEGKKKKKNTYISTLIWSMWLIFMNKKIFYSSSKIVTSHTIKKSYTTYT